MSQLCSSGPALWEVELLLFKALCGFCILYGGGKRWIWSCAGFPAVFSLFPSQNEVVRNIQNIVASISECKPHIAMELSAAAWAGMALPWDMASLLSCGTSSASTPAYIGLNRIAALQMKKNSCMFIGSPCLSATSCHIKCLFFFPKVKIFCILHDVNLYLIFGNLNYL